MAEKKKRNNKSVAEKKSVTKKSTASQKAESPAQKTQIPVRLITSLVSLGLLVLFSVMLINPEGALVKLLYQVVVGLIGYTSFVVSIPALLYLFVIQGFSGKRPVIARSVCLLVFVFLCGCISQLSLPAIPEDANPVGFLYVKAVDLETAGLLCGGFGILIRALFGTVMSYIIFIVAALLTLLGSMKITIPSIIRAVENRPRADWEEEEENRERREPAAVVVDHLAAKHIERVENRRRMQSEQISISEYEEAAAEAQKKKMRSRATDLMSQIGGDPDEPVTAAHKKVRENLDVDLLPVNGQPVKTAQNEKAETVKTESSAPVVDMPVPQTVNQDSIPVQMPDLIPEPPLVQPAPAVEMPQQKVTAKDAYESAVEVAAEIAQAEANAETKPEYRFPPIDLLKLPAKSSLDGTSEMRENSRKLNEALDSFKIEAQIVNVTRGPSVTRYEVELDKGVRLNKLTSCADDIALSLGAPSVRIAAVPDKSSVVGIEVPNKAVTMVSLREVIDSAEFSKAKSKSSFAVGKDIAGNCIVGNIAKLPHMLIAGTTGSGKSVCMNSIIISLLYKASPDDVKLIMVDPKMVELGIYNGIPHLLIPVVTDPKKAAGSLQWAVTEMMRRYKSMSDAGVRDLESYNSIVDQEEGGQKLPQVVVIIDELADLMLVAAKEVEESICRIAQMGRAAGIHLIIATQRPSADVITGLMKANIPSRIAFSVASAMESRIILDTQGAEKLVGKGDMFFSPIGQGKPKRVQGCFVSDPEVEAVASYVKENFNTDYDLAVLDEIEKKAAQTGNKAAAAAAADPEPAAGELEGDELLPQAVDVVMETGQASASMLQRRLKLGYARAARIIDEMEERGIVGPFQGSKPRSILISKEQWAAMKSGEPAQLQFSDLEQPEEPLETEELE